jgi:squalene-associated FAD-dependent desaturase
MGSLPHPLGLAQAFFGYRFLALQERVRLLHTALPLRVLEEKDLAPLDDISAGQWLRRCKQSANAIAALWQPIVLATMNTDVEQASARLLVVVLGEMFMGGAAASALWLPGAGLSELFADPARVFLERHHADVHLHAPVKRIDPSDSGATVTLADGSAHDARSVVAALPPWDLAGVFDDAVFPAELKFHTAQFVPSPIVSIHVWSRTEFTTQPITGLLGTTLQWVFAKGKNADGLFRYAITVSAASGLLEMDERAITRMVEKELRVLYPALRDGDIARMKIIRERAATFAPLPGMERHRPGAESGMPGVFLAGDWTNTGLPATIEGAVRSGESAAASALEYLTLD